MTPTVLWRLKPVVTCGSPTVHSGVMEVFDTATNERLAPLDLKSADAAHPSPDLMDIAPPANRMFISLRGPSPLTGDPHVSTGTTPGVMVMRIEADGSAGAESKRRHQAVDRGMVGTTIPSLWTGLTPTRPAPSEARERPR
jgi:hypothetical protein